MYEDFHDALYRFSLTKCKLLFKERLFKCLYSVIIDNGTMENFILNDENIKPTLDLHLKLAKIFMA